ncbi:protein phosphatase 2c containing protein [Stylonychia lemnae]|uniref:Protein phosphatase 2c containing protein n=1 Tax=Stylonychia lemnae TaxID=5949 RepID=A0A078AP51_STYLE|nr:protein phosphatase 2c containing protein [Stylonychia lemnae]|eukprot:CDW83899.1 protein phosphatase 2c containing protein [Stylonychia lemnae]
MYFHNVLSPSHIQQENHNKLHVSSVEAKKSNTDKLQIGIPANDPINYSHTLAVSKQLQTLNIKTPQTNSIYFPELAQEQRKSQSILKRRPFDLERKIKIKDLKIIQDSSNILKVEIKKDLENLNEKKNKETPSNIQNINNINSNYGNNNNNFQLSLSKSSKQLLPSLDIKKAKQKPKKESQVQSESEAKSPQPEESEKQSAKNLLSLAYASQKGQSSIINKVNQDRLVIRKKLCGIDNLYLIAVADGHGINGHLVSKHIKKILAQVVEFEDKRLVQQRFSEKLLSSIFGLAEEDRQVFQTLVKQLLSKVFNNVNKQIESQKSFDIQMSGSTLVVAIVSPQFIITGNCGDSRCIVINIDGSIAIQTSDHKPNRPDEKQRIEHQYRGRVRRQGELNPLYRGHTDLNEQPYRVWAKDLDMPGLAMSRSIGDQMAKNLGVIAEPEVQIYEYSPDQQPYAIALASDGIWDVIESKDFSDMMHKIQIEGAGEQEPQSKQSEIGCKDYVNQIVKNAHQMWVDEGQPQTPAAKKVTPEVDDITLVLGIFKRNFHNQQ